MKEEFQAHFTIKHGQFVWKSQAYMDHWLPQLEGKSGLMVIKKKFNKRSLDQNALYWVWLETISDDTGQDKKTIHQVYKGLFAPRKVFSLNGKTYSVPKGTSEMSVGEMVEFMMKVEAEAGQMGIKLPHPEDLYALTN